MKVYIVITNGEEVKGEVEGVFAKKADAKKKFNKIKKDWKDWAKGSEYDYESGRDYFSLTSFDYDEFMEVMIKTAEIK